MTDILNADITITGVEPKEGVSAKTGKAWKLYKIHSAEGASYSTFDGTLGAASYGAVGKRAHITYRVTEKGNDLVALNVTGDVPPEPVRDRAPDGAADWDMIGLRKTRCALWVAAIGAGMAVSQAREIVRAAEVDIFHRQPAVSGDEVPF